MLLVESVQMNVSNQITCNKRSASEVYLQWSLQQSNFAPTISHKYELYCNVINVTLEQNKKWKCEI